MDLRVLCYGLWLALHPGLPGEKDAPKIAEAIYATVGGDKAPLFGGREEEAAVMALFAVKESWLRSYAVGDHGTSYGVWQQKIGGRGSIENQAKAWVKLLHAGARACPVSPTTPLLSGNCHDARHMANARVAEALRILATLRAQR